MFGSIKYLLFFSWVTASYFNAAAEWPCYLFNCRRDLFAILFLWCFLNSKPSFILGCAFTAHKHLRRVTVNTSVFMSTDFPEGRHCASTSVWRPCTCAHRGAVKPSRVSVRLCTLICARLGDIMGERTVKLDQARLFLCEFPAVWPNIAPKWQARPGLLQSQ